MNLELKSLFLPCTFIIQMTHKLWTYMIHLCGMYVKNVHTADAKTHVASNHACKVTNI